MSVWNTLKQRLGLAARPDYGNNRLVRDLGLDDPDRAADLASATGPRSAGRFVFLDLDRIQSGRDADSLWDDGDDDTADAEADAAAPSLVVEDIEIPQTVTAAQFPLADRVIRECLRDPFAPASDELAQQRQVQALYLALHDAAQLGDPGAAAAAAMMLIRGLGTAPNPSEAFRLAWSSATRGSAAGEYVLGRLFEAGQGGPRDEDQAVLWLEKSAAQGFRYSELRLAQKFEAGAGVPQNLATALVWYRKSASHGLREAQFRLAQIYADGLGVRQSLDAALSWYERAANAGHPQANLIMGRAYLDGSAGPRDPLRAARHLQTAAEHGLVEATLVLAELMVESARPNFAEAERMLEGAVAAGLPGAADLLERVTQAHLAHVQALAARGEQEATVGPYGLTLEDVLTRVANILAEIREDAAVKTQQPQLFGDAGATMLDAAARVEALLPAIDAAATLRPADAVRRLADSLEHGIDQWRSDHSDRQGFGEAVYLEVLRAVRDILALHAPPQKKAETLPARA